MDIRLYESSLTGNVNSLLELLEEDELILDRVLTEFVPETPLHIACLRGHVNFAIEILGRKPQLAHVLSSQGLSPLHMASANGYVNIIRALLRLISDVSHDRDRQGRTPLHVAAMKGQVDVLDEFIRIKPESIRDMTGRDETVLHLCVKYDQFEALKMLIGFVADDGEFVNRKDENGNTILHLAAMKMQIPMMKFLIDETRVDRNTMNMNGLTALNVLALCPSESGDMEMAEILRRKGAKRAWEMTTPQEITPTPNQVREFRTPSAPSTAAQSNLPILDELGMKSIEEFRSIIIVVGVLTLTLSFQASVTPPGGLWQDDSNDTSNGKNHTAGTSILADKDPVLFYAFYIFNQMVFGSSLCMILMSKWLGKRRFVRDASSAILVYLTVALFSMAVAFCLCIAAHEPKRIRRVPSWLTVLTSIMVFLILFGGIAIAPFIWQLRKSLARARP